MKSAIRRIEKLEQRNMPARQTPFDRNLIERVEAGCRRVKTDREAHGMSDPSDEGLPTVRLHTALGIQLTIDILHDGRGRNHLRWLRDKQPHWSGPLVPKAKETRGRMADRRLESSMASPGSAKATMTSRNSDTLLANEVSKCYADPLRYVLMAYPWGEKGGPLENEQGPDENQRQFLVELGREVRARGFGGTDPVLPLLMSATSGHGTGKTVMGAWIGDWILSTRPDSIGTVTAGTWTQLDSRTWAALRHWTQLSITRHWFDIQAHGIFHKLRPNTWKVTAQTCKEQNAQAFAGQHARTSTSWYMFDEASLVPDAVWTVAQGGLTDGEPMHFAWGQPERNTGRFYEVNFGKQEHRWNHRTIDSRTSRFANKELLAEWLADYGEDSDYYRVRVLGLPPTADELQFIDRARILAAQQRTAQSLSDDPLIVGVDVSGGGSAWNVICFRRGLDARTILRIRIPGEHTRDRSVLVGKLAEILRDQRPGRKVAAMFIDMAFGSPIYERLRQLGFNNVHETNFGLTHTPERSMANMRAYMWFCAKDYLLTGAIEADEKMASDLAGPGYGINRSNKLVLESKEEMRKRGQASPDDGDAFVLTFAQPVAPVEKEEPDEEEAFSRFGNFPGGGHGSWMR